ncbi:hypothetical protein [Candidatus Thiosymbion oneisti]|uniref:hypothetical protein n=1 Tax=Candidatus Thiosymbion oneisti TaxID=589554 RepID=UPI00105E38F3|nr:hypothetical protein [Candidatus Thiosymbion oneisti]
MITLKAAKNPSLSVVMTGLPRIKHELSLRLKGRRDPLYQVADFNFNDAHPDDVDSDAHVDVYPIGTAIAGKSGFVLLEWSVVIAKVAADVPYQVVLAVMQDGASVFAQTYSNTDPDAGTGSVRFELGMEVFNIA